MRGKYVDLISGFCPDAYCILINMLFGYKENPDYDTFEAFEKTRRDFTVYSSVEGIEPGLMLKSLYIAGQWGEQEEILMDDFSEDTGEFEEIGSAAAKEVKKVLVLFKSKGIKP